MFIAPLVLILFLCFIFRKSLFNNDFFSFSSNLISKKKKLMTIEDKYNENKVSEQNELNILLEKINKKGYDRLSNKEKSRLDILSKKQL